jgi:hypothetical protein
MENIIRDGLRKPKHYLGIASSQINSLSTEGRRYVTFSSNSDYVSLRNHKETLKEYEGWVNKATWEFNLLFFQEPWLCSSFINFRRLDGTFNEDRVIRLFNQSQYGRRMELIDKHSLGIVDVKEIINNWMEQHNV